MAMNCLMHPRVIVTKRRHVYRSVKHVFSTINIVERLFSRANIVLRDLRNRILPRHLEDMLYMQVNRHLWNEVTVQMIINRPQPAVQEVN